jgi:plasmid stability protein
MASPSAYTVLRDTFADAVTEARASVGEAFLAQLLETRNVAGLGRAFDQTFQRNRETIEGALAKAVRKGLREGQQKAGLTSGVSLVLPDNIDQYARLRAATLARGWELEQRALLEKLVSGGVRPGMTAKETARLIRAVIGLTERDANAVITQRVALASDKIMKPSLANTIAETYGKRLNTARAKMIGSTETNIARNKGQEAVWKAAQTRGFLAAAVMRRWRVTEDERLCKTCQAMDGQTAPLDGYWTLPNGTQVQTPGEAHPRCRCEEDLEGVLASEAA